MNNLAQKRKKSHEVYMFPALHTMANGMPISSRELAEKIGCSRRTAQRILMCLVETGAVHFFNSSEGKGFLYFYIGFGVSSS